VKRSLGLLFLGLFAAFLLGLGGGCSAAVETGEPEIGTESEALTQKMARDQIVALAQGGVGFSYKWGGDQWDPSDKAHPGKCIPSCAGCGCPSCTHSGSWGADCSGYLAKVWQVPGPISVSKSGGHPYVAASFAGTGAHWTAIKMSKLQRGDALGSSHHVFLFDRWLSNGQVMAYECAGCAAGCRHGPRSIPAGYTAVRRNNVVDEPPPNKPPKGWLNEASCDTIAGWAQDPDQPKKAVSVLLTFGGPYTKPGVTKKTVLANGYRKDLCKWLGSCNHWFEIPTPTDLKDGKKHVVYAYAIDTSGKPKKRLSLAPKTLECGGPGGCAHSPCKTGVMLGQSCNTCVNAVCLGMPHCCNGTWDAECVAQMTKTSGACAGVCAGGNSTCVHSECSQGAMLHESCSPCATSVCSHDALCCNGKWDQYCTWEAKDNPYCSCN
jgi:hypothetical protein